MSVSVAFRNNETILRERVDRLELSLARTTGQLFAAKDARARLEEELATLRRDPVALATARNQARNRRAALILARILGTLLFSTGLLPLVLASIGILGSGEIGAGLACATVPLLLVAGVVTLKLPDVLAAIEFAQARKDEARKARMRADNRVRVAAFDDDQEDGAARELLDDETSPPAVRHRER